MLQKLYQRIYLSPHLDDAVLSCGGLIFQERRADLSVLVLTPLAGAALWDGVPSPIIADLHSRWELEAISNPVAARKAEDREALSVLQADVLHWEWPECVYRRHPTSGDFLYPTEESLWGTVHSAEKYLVTEIAQNLADLPLAPAGRIYVPLTVGNHVDHHLVRQAAETWGAPQGQMVYFEEYPYAERPEALATVLKDRKSWQAEIVPLDAAALDAKAAAVACYRSQISTFFAGEEEIAPRLRAYATAAGAGQQWAERYWHRR
jgi:LmbE family N-acetylglucosaminyl deacetylase